MDVLENIPSRGMMPTTDQIHLNATGTPAGAATASVSNAAAIAMSDSALSQALVAWLNQALPVFSGQITQYSPQMQAFFSNTANMPYVRAALAKYGMNLTIIPKGPFSLLLYNRANYWFPYWRLWKAAYYYQTFPIPAADPANCTMIGTMLGAVAQEISNVKAQQVQGTLTTDEYSNTVFVLEDIQSTITGMYSSLDCTDAEQQQQTAQNLATTTAVTNSALSNPTGITGIAGLASNTLLYGIAGIFVIGAIIVIFHHSAKATA